MFAMLKESRSRINLADRESLETIFSPKISETNELHNKLV